MATEDLRSKRAEQEQLEDKYTFRLMTQVVAVIGMLIIVLTLFFLYLIFGTQAHDMWQSPKPVAKEETQRRIQKHQVALEIDPDRIEHGIHKGTGLVAAPGWELVRGNCTGCHSAKLITQNRASREGWQSMIRWMQETQGLWDLGENEASILEYLATNYAPKEEGRRAKLDVENIEWYVLNLD